jgi:DNA-binding response OmpR family regulator
MPKKDGFEVLIEMGKQGLTEKIPVLVFSTLGQEKDVEHARMLGAKGYVNKSFFDFDKLYARIIELSKK